MTRLPPHVILGLGLGLALAVARARAGELAPPDSLPNSPAGAGIVRSGSASVERPGGSTACIPRYGKAATLVRC